jgi:hypothetical protein
MHQITRRDRLQKCLVTPTHVVEKLKGLHKRAFRSRNLQPHWWQRQHVIMSHATLVSHDVWCMTVQHSTFKLGSSLFKKVFDVNSLIERWMWDERPLLTRQIDIFGPFRWLLTAMKKQWLHILQVRLSVMNVNTHFKMPLLKCTRWCRDLEELTTDWQRQSSEWGKYKMLSGKVALNRSYVSGLTWTVGIVCLPLSSSN